MDGNANHPPGVFATFLILIGVVVFMAGLLSLYALAGIGQPAFGFIFLLYWAAILRQEPKAYLKTILGGITGILLGAFMDRSLAYSPVMMGLQYFSIAVLLFLYMRGSLGIIVNNALMLYMTVSTIPAVDALKNYRMLIGSLLIGAFYMGVVSLAARRYRSWSAGRAAASSGGGLARSDLPSDPKPSRNVT